MPRDPESPRARHHAHRRQRPFGRQQRHRVADRQPQVPGQVHADQDAGHIFLGARLQVAHAPRRHRAPQVGDLGFQRRVDALERHKRIAALGAQQRLAQNGRRRADHAVQGAQLGDLLAVVHAEAVALPHVDVRASAEDPVAQLSLQPGHQRQRDDERRHAHRDAKGRDERDDRDERLLAPRQQVAEGDVEFEGHWSTGSRVHRFTGSRVHRFTGSRPSRLRAFAIVIDVHAFDSRRRMCGNKMTSRIDGLPVRTITRRSMPIPSPPVGGRPYSSART